MARRYAAAMTEEPLTDEELANLEDLAQRASPGPWKVFAGPGIGGPDFISIGVDDERADMYVMHDANPAPQDDLDFIAAARNAMPRLISELKGRRRGAET